ncbi:hypothetical protein ACLOJK_017247 [Asimina triloba]
MAIGVDEDPDMDTLKRIGQVPAIEDINGIRKAPLLKILSVDLLAKSTKKTYANSMQPIRNGSQSGSRGCGNYVPKAGDIFALSNVEPSSVGDLKRDGASFILGLVKKNEGDEGGPPPFQIQARVSKHFEAPAGKWASVFAVFFSNLTTNDRMWKALHFKGRSTPGIIQEVLRTNSSFHGSRAMQAQALNPTYMGSPGTGKTNTIGAILLLLLESKCRVLTCAPTNVAVAEVASRLLKLVKKSFGDDELCPLGDMVLVGNEERMNITDDLRDIFFGERINSLVGCFVTDNMVETSADAKEEDVGPLDFGKFARIRFGSIADTLQNSIRMLYTHLPSATIRESNFASMVRALKSIGSLQSSLAKASNELLNELFTSGGEVNDVSLARKECLGALIDLKENFQIPRFLDRDSIRAAPIVFCTASKGIMAMPQTPLLALGSWVRGHHGNATQATLSTHIPLHPYESLFTPGSAPRILHQPFELVVIDEAAQLKECESLVPLQLPGMHAILIGDELQLPAMVQSQVCERAGFGRSLFERLSSMGQRA